MGLTTPAAARAEDEAVDAQEAARATDGDSASRAGVRWAAPFCSRAPRLEKATLRSAANIDLYHGLLYFTIAGGLTSLEKPSQRWSAVNSFDSKSQNLFRIESLDGRRNADRASDLTLATSIAILPIASIAAQQWRTGDCAESWDMATDLVESFGLALMFSEITKLAGGRARPFVRGCGPDAPTDSSCGQNDRFRSFVSGHATLASTGAGVTCAFSIKREAWGSSLAARALPCGFGVAAAAATGALRISANRHWMTDVLAGFVIGGTIGWFDTWGPLEWLAHEERDADGRLESFGALLPASIEGRPGFRFTLVY